MTQILFQDNAQAFAHQATAELLSFMTSANANSNINFLSDFLNSFAPPIEFYDSAFAQSGGQWPIRSGPVVFIASTTTRVLAANSKRIHVEGRTDFEIRDSQPNPYDASARVMQIAGAIASLFKQTIFDQNNTDWSQFYSKEYPDGVVVNQVTCPGAPVMEIEGGLLTGRVHQKLTAFWYHGEALT